MDGIKCFDLEQQSLHDLRLSLGSSINGESQSNMMINDSLQMWQECEKLKKENETLRLYRDKTEREQLNFGANLGNIITSYPIMFI